MGVIPDSQILRFTRTRYLFVIWELAALPSRNTHLPIGSASEFARAKDFFIELD